MVALLELFTDEYNVQLVYRFILFSFHCEAIALIVDHMLCVCVNFHIMK